MFNFHERCEDQILKFEGSLRDLGQSENFLKNDPRNFRAFRDSFWTKIHTALRLSGNIFDIICVYQKLTNI